MQTFDFSVLLRIPSEQTKMNINESKINGPNSPAIFKKAL